MRGLVKRSPEPDRVRSDVQPHQEPFVVVAPTLLTALWTGAAGGFVLASVLSVTLAMRAPLGVWWLALAQAHGHLQLYGWAGLFVLGVALHFVPRLRGAPLTGARAMPWALGFLLTALILRGASQPLLASSVGPMWLWQAALVASGVCEIVGVACVLAMFLGVSLRPGAPRLRDRPALWSIFPFVVTAGVSLGVAALVNLVNVVRAASAGGLVPAGGDSVNVLLGLFGFLVPMAIGMSTRALPMYAGLDAFPRRVLWPAAFIYDAGLALTAWGSAYGLVPDTALGRVGGFGLFLMGGVVVGFIGLFGWLMSRRGHLPQKVRALAPEPEQVAHAYIRRVAQERTSFGPYVALIASAYVWAFLGGLLLLVDGAALSLGYSVPLDLDVARHSFAVGFIALLIAGVSVRMIPGFSGGRIASPRWVVALLWIGNGAALMRVGSLLLAPTLSAFGSAGTAVASALFGVSGPLGLAFAICLLITLRPAVMPVV